MTATRMGSALLVSTRLQSSVARKRVARRRCLPLGLLIACALSGAGACGEDADETAPVQTPVGAPELALLTVETSIGEAATLPAKEPVQLGCDRSVSFSVGPNPKAGQLKNWLLRPPRACNGRPQCGFLKLTVDLGSETVEAFSSTTFVSVDLPALAKASGDRTVRAELLDDDGVSFKLANGKPVRAEASFQLTDAVGCNAGEGGASGSGGAAGQAGASQDPVNSP